VFRIVGRLNHRKETKAMRNEMDLPLRRLSNCGQGEMGTVAESLPAPEVESEETAEESEEKLERLKVEVTERLGGDQRAKAVFRCMCHGLLRNAKIAEALGMTEKVVRTARRRVKRRIRELKREGLGR
jgi:DNA-directed RNA polymerase specialized sigma24 family protein